MSPTDTRYIYIVSKIVAPQEDLMGAEPPNIGVYTREYDAQEHFDAAVIDSREQGGSLYFEMHYPPHTLPPYLRDRASLRCAIVTFPDHKRFFFRIERWVMRKTYAKEKASKLPVGSERFYEGYESQGPTSGGSLAW